MGSGTAEDAFRTNLPTPDVYGMDVPGVKHPFLVRPDTSDIPTYRQVFERGDYEFTPDREPEVIVDAGANIGLAAIFFATQYPEARIVALEPEIGNFALLRKNTDPYEQITAVRAALWDSNGTVRVVDPGLGHWGFMTEEDTGRAGEVGEFRHHVRAMTVDRLIEEYDLERIDILKIDIEGAEREVFQDPSPWIDAVDVMIVELHERMKRGCEASFAKVSDAFPREWKQQENIFLSR